MTNNLLEQSIKYHELGLVTIPIIGKRPAIEWKEYQNRLPAEEEMRLWFADNSEVTGIAVVTGKLSGIIVLDVDNGANLKNLDVPETITVKTGNGRHYYFRYPGYEVITKAGILPKIDIRGDHGCAVLPPSKHQNGNTYAWEVPFDRAKLADIPDWLKEKIQNKPNSIKNTKNKIKGVNKGERNDSAASLIGKLLAGLNPEDWNEVAWPLIESWNQNNNPPLSEKELKTVFDSIASAELQSREDEEEVATRRKAEKLVKLVLDGKTILFCDQFNEPFIAVNGDGSRVIKLNSKPFRRWLSYKAWTELEETFGSETVRTAIGILEGHASFESDSYELQVRVAGHKNGILYDLGNGQIIEITKEGWNKLEVPPIAFRHLQHQKSQPDPTKGGDIKKLLKYINVRKEADNISGDLLLTLVSIISAFIPGLAHPVTALFGPQGSAKTTLSRIFKELVDPSALKTFTVPDSVREFVQLVSHHWVVPFDNLSELSETFSDSMCRAVTGDGFSKRELYTDDDDIVYEFQRVLLLNGINLAVQKPDLLDRSIIISLERINNFEEEKSFWSRFYKEKPEILGAIFSTISLALSYIDDMPKIGNIRMSDFVNLGCSITKALGYDPDDFIRAYEKNISKQNEEALDASPVAVAILNLMENKDIWQGTPTELLTEFSERAGLLKINIKAKSWPKDAHWLWKRIQEARTNLEARGIKTERSRDEHKRYIVISKPERNSVSAVSNVIGAKKQPDLLTTEMTTSESKNKGGVNLFGENDYE